MAYNQLAPQSTLVSGGVPMQGGFTPSGRNILAQGAKKVKDHLTKPWNDLGAATKVLMAARKGKRPLTPEESRFIAESTMAVSADTGTFIGAKGIAQLGKSDILLAAKKLKRAGIPDDQIWKELGVTFGFADNMPRMEISDDAASLTGKASGSANEVLNHPELFKAYPNMKVVDTTVKIDPKLAHGGEFNPTDNTLYTQAPDPNTALRVLGHEAQHAIQSEEGLALGGNSRGNYRVERDLLIEEIFRKLQPKLSKTGVSDAEIYKAAEKIVKIPKSGGKVIYNRLAGEVESRLTQSRMELSEAQRRAQYPPNYFDIPVSQQIVRFDGGVVASEKVSRATPKNLSKLFEDLTGHNIDTAGTRLAGHEVRRGMAEARGKAFTEPYPYTPEQLKVLDSYKALSKTSPYLFHTTDRANLSSIADKGLLPNLPKRQEGVSGNYVYLSANEALAESFGKPGDILVRTKKSTVFNDLEEDLLSGGGAYQTASIVPPEVLEFKIGKKWLPLLNQSKAKI